MKLLKNERAWRRWVVGERIDKALRPQEFPCFGYTDVLSFGMEETEAKYLYRTQLLVMSAALEKEISR